MIHKLLDQARAKNEILTQLEKAKDALLGFMPIYKTEIEDLQNRIKEIQDNCPHAKTRYTHTTHRGDVYQCCICKKFLD